MDDGEEPWDELMGPSRKDVQTYLQTGSRHTPSAKPVDVPPATAFGLSDRWAKYERKAEELRAESNIGLSAERSRYQQRTSHTSTGGTSRRSVSLPIEDEDEPTYYGKEDAIRAEAMKMLELADDHLSSPYSVRKTASGGFTAGPPLPSSTPYTMRRTNSTGDSHVRRHVPAALAGLNLSSYRETSRDFRKTNLVNDPPEEDNGSGHSEEDNLVESLPVDQESRWSSRYSIDSTLLALSGGIKPADILKGMDRDTQREAKSARNMYMSSPHEFPKVFGSGFSFRQDNVFGKQNVTVEQQQNLRSVWTDLDSNGRSLKPPEPRKTWQEQLERKKRRRRVILFSLLVLLFSVTVVWIISTRRQTDAQTGNNPSSIFAGKTPDVTFYVTSDVPYDASEENKLTNDLKALPGDAQFLVHLGNIQNSAVTLCARGRYPGIKSELLKSPVPLFMLPGEEDWNNCPNPTAAWETWETNFGHFETHFVHNIQVDRQLRRRENFGFLLNNVLFLGFHLVGGRIDDASEWESRNADNVNWMESMMFMNSGNFHSMVLLGNARPSPQQRAFFDRLSAAVADLDIPAIYIHANSGVGGLLKYDLFDRDQHIEGLQIEDGGRNPPVRISVYKAKEPFVVG